MSTILLDQQIKLLDRTDANLVKLQHCIDRLDQLDRGGAEKGGMSRDDCIRSICDIWEALPSIDGWKPELQFFSDTEMALMRIDAHELGEPSIVLETEEMFASAHKAIEEYGYRFRRKRMSIARDRIRELISNADAAVDSLRLKLGGDDALYSEEHRIISEAVEQVDVLLGSAFVRPPRWGDLRRHLSFWDEVDVEDVVVNDWPAIFPVLSHGIYAEDEPIDVGITDLNEIDPVGRHDPVTTALSWSKLSTEDFERLIFNLISTADGYEDPKWLTRTNAPDRGRDLSVYRVYNDPLGATLRQRVIIQCKHWQTKSVSMDEVATLQGQMSLWEPPTVDCVVIATSGRFTSDAVDFIERQNQSGRAPRIDMWPESHLEMLLASKPSLVAEFGLR